MAAVGFLSHYQNGPLTICLTPYNRRYNVLSASLNKTFLSITALVSQEIIECLFYSYGRENTMRFYCDAKYTQNHTYRHIHI